MSDNSSSKNSRGRRRFFLLRVLAWLGLLLFPFMGVALGGLVGYLRYARESMVYEAQALVHVQASNVPARSTDYSNAGATADDLSAMRSRNVLEKAAQIGELDQFPAFQGQSPAEIASTLASSDDLEIVEATADDNLILVSFEHEDFNVPVATIHAILSAYQEHVDEAPTSAEAQSLGRAPKLRLLNVPEVASFGGPHWLSYVLSNAAIGFVAMSIFALLAFVPGLLSITLWSSKE